MYHRLILFFLTILLTSNASSLKTCVSNSTPRKYISLNCIKKLFDNFHTVQPGALYRSGQLSSQKLAKYIQKLGIKSIINLRGKNADKRWWQEEHACAKRFGVHFFNISMSAQRLPYKQELIQLLQLYDHAPRPILIHCQGGADRTGEAAALWILDQQKKSKQEALKHLSLKYLHIAYRKPYKKFFIETVWQDRSWLLTAYNHNKYTLSKK